MLDIWPALPLVIRGSGYAASQGKGADDGIIAALKHNDRVHQILLDGFSSSLLEEVVAVMQVPFPALTNLEIISWGETATVVPEAFLGRSAQRLQSCIVQGIAFSGQWKLLLTANHLVILRLEDIPHSGYISPDTMVTCLSAMPNLKQLDLGFRSSRSRPDRASQRPPLLIRVIHPSLTHFWFQGISEYMEDLVSRIDVPLLDNLDILFFDQLIFNTPQLHNFLARTEKFQAHNQAAVVFYDDAIFLKAQFSSNSSLKLGITCTKSDWQISSMAQICSSSLVPFSTLERLDLREGRNPLPLWQDEVENTQWLELLRPFTALKDLYFKENFVPLVAPALQELIGERVTKGLPSLRNLFVEGFKQSGPLHETIGQFVASRQLSDPPVAIHNWDGQSY